MIKEAAELLLVKYGVQNTLLLALMAKFMWDMRVKYIAIDIDLKNVKEGVHEVKEKVDKIETEQYAIKNRLSIAEKFGQKKETNQGFTDNRSQ